GKEGRVVGGAEGDGVAAGVGSYVGVGEGRTGGGHSERGKDLEEGQLFSGRHLDGVVGCRRRWGLLSRLGRLRRVRKGEPRGGIHCALEESLDGSVRRALVLLGLRQEMG